MRTDTEIIYDAYNILTSSMDILEIERFIMLVKRDNFDYSEWRKDLWEDLSIEEITQRAMDFSRNKRK
ncbi:MAG: hypothetical protein AB7S75_07175 [Desulfococcaceae bacterium]